MAGDLAAVQADAETPVDGASVELVTDAATVVLVVPPAGRWKTRANRALNTGDFDTWAELSLSAEDFDSWQAADPTNDDVKAFFVAWQEAAGEDPKRSSGSPRSSRSTTKR